jgi:hypothetical protein
MVYRLANIEGRAALGAGEHYFGVEAASNGSISSDPMAALGIAKLTFPSRQFQLF